MVKSSPYSNNATDITFATSTTSGSTTAGALSISVHNIGAGAGTVGGIALAAGEGWDFTDNGPYNSIAFNATGTTFEIVEENE